MSKNRGKWINQLEHSWIIGSLIYVINSRSPDIAYSISKLSRFTSNPNMDHWRTIKGVLKYLRYILDYELHYNGYLAIL
jgi:hypothetical protein